MMIYDSEYHHSISDEQACLEIKPSDPVIFKNHDYDFSELKEPSADFSKTQIVIKNKNEGLNKHEETNELKISNINLTTNSDQKR